MAKLEPIWQNIPAHFKRSLVGKLNYTDRCSLRTCSRDEKELVDSCRNELECVAVQIRHDHSLFSFSDDSHTYFSVKYHANRETNQMRVEIFASPVVFKPSRNKRIMWKKTAILDEIRDENDIDFAIRDFAMAIRKGSVKKILINDVIVNEYHEKGSGDRKREFEAKILKTFGSLSKHVIAETLHLKWNSDENQIARLVGSFDPNRLRRIELSARDDTWQLRDVARMEQWRRAKEVWLEVKHDLTVDDLLHCRRIQTYVVEMRPDEVWRVIERFIAKREHLASFHLSCRDTDVELDALLAKFNVPPHDQPITGDTILRKSLSSRFIHTQRFAIPSTRLVLVVMISAKEVLGTVCHVDAVNSEAKVELGLLRQ